MITNDEQLQQAYEALGDLYRALASYRSKILRVNPSNYAVIAQGPLEEIRKIQFDINAYLGLSELQKVSEDSPALREDSAPCGQKPKK